MEVSKDNFVSRKYRCMLKEMKDRDITKPRNNHTAIFFQLFLFNTETHKETNSADIGSVEKFVACTKRVSRRGCLNVQWIH